MKRLISQKHTKEKETLKDEVANAIEETRIVVPGIQALFGFQTIAVFNDRFDDLPAAGRIAHLLALTLVAISIACILAPAAFHRIAERGLISRQMVELTSRLICAAMIALMLGLNLDIFVVLLLASGTLLPSISIAVAILGIFTVLWFVVPYRSRRQRRQQEKDARRISWRSLGFAIRSRKRLKE
jgi:signal transduction histidine kinase